MKGGESMDFEELLKQYDSPAVESPSLEDEPIIQRLPEEPKPEPQPQDETAWQGNPLYYQSGKKQGQLRQLKPRGITVGYQPSSEPQEIGGDLISGAMFMSIIDMLIPGLIVVINNFLVKDKKDILKISEMQLDEKQIKKLEPLTEATLKQIKLRANPSVLLIFTLLGLYSIQFAKIKFERELDKAMNDKKKEEK